MRRALLAALVLATAPGAGAASAQTFATDDPVLRSIWTQAMNNSQVEDLAQVLLDSVGPRLTGSPGMDAAHDWAVKQYGAWGIDARNEQYGTWRGWDRGVTHIDLIEPRVRTLEGMMLAWSPGTNGRNVEGDVVILPEFASAAEFRSWLPQVRNRFVLVSYAQESCRPLRQFEEFGMEGALDAQREGVEAISSSRVREHVRAGEGAEPRMVPEGEQMHDGEQDAAIGDQLLIRLPETLLHRAVVRIACLQRSLERRRDASHSAVGGLGEQ